MGKIVEARNQIYGAFFNQETLLLIKMHEIVR